MRAAAGRDAAETQHEEWMAQKPQPARWNGEIDTGEQQQLAKRRLLLREAGRAFGERGFHNTTLDDVALSLGISKTIFYHYFGNKNDVLKTCVEIGFEIADGALATVSTMGTDGLGRVTEFVRLYVEAITSEIGACAVVLEMKSLRAEDYQVFLARQRAFDRKLRALVQSGVDDGSIGATDVRAAVSWIMGGPSMLARWFRPSGRISAQEIATQYAVFARRSLEASRS
jgi:AcrR family transcriptional regulator